MILKEGDLVSGVLLRSVVDYTNAKVTAIWDGGAFRETLAPEDIEDCDVFRVRINYGHEVQFVLVSSEDRCILTLDRVVGKCKEFVDEEGILQPAKWIVEV